MKTSDIESALYKLGNASPVDVYLVRTLDNIDDEIEVVSSHITDSVDFLDIQRQLLAQKEIVRKIYEDLKKINSVEDSIKITKK